MSTKYENNLTHRHLIKICICKMAIWSWRFLRNHICPEVIQGRKKHWVSLMTKGPQASASLHCQNWLETKNNETWSTSIIAKEKWKFLFCFLSKLPWDSELPKLGLEKRFVFNLIGSYICNWQNFCAYHFNLKGRNLLITLWLL